MKPTANLQTLSPTQRPLLGALTPPIPKGQVFPPQSNRFNLDSGNGSRINREAVSDRPMPLQGAFRALTALGITAAIAACPQPADASTNLVSLGALNGTNGFRFSAVTASSRFGRSVAVGDINDDGFADFCVGQPNSDFCWILYGSAGGPPHPISAGDLDGSNGFQVAGIASSVLGQSIAAGFDFNGDGIGDLAISAPLADIHGTDSGEVYVIFGDSNGFAHPFDATTLNGTNGIRVEGREAGHRLGVSSLASGDLNGDGRDDLIMGVPDADLPGSNSGGAFVLFGTNGLASPFDLASLDGTNGFLVEGQIANDQLGVGVGAGDVNGDGFAELLAGAPYSDPVASSSGATYVVFGKSGPFTHPLPASSVDGTNGFRIDGPAASATIGFSVDAAGDVDGDGLNDVLIGAYRADLNGVDSGATFLIYGRSNGFPAVLPLAGLNATNGFGFAGEAAGDRLGAAVRHVGDLNADNIGDLAAGAIVAGNNRGQVYVAFGTPDRNALAATLTNLNGTNGFTVRGELFNDRIGRSLGAGDFNGDGGSDLMLGAPYASDIGAAFVIYGEAKPPGSTTGGATTGSAGTSSGSTTAGTTSGSTTGTDTGSTAAGSTSGSTTGTDTGSTATGSTSGSTTGTNTGSTATGSTSGSTSGTTGSTAGGVSAGSTTAGSTTSGSGTGSLACTNALAQNAWTLSLKRPKDPKGKGLKFTAGKRGLGTVKGAVSGTGLETKSTAVQVEIALLSSNQTAAFATNPCASISWSPAERVGKVNKRGAAKFSSPKFAADAALASGESFEIWLRASTNLDSSSSAILRNAFRVR